MDFIGELYMIAYVLFVGIACVACGYLLTRKKK